MKAYLAIIFLMATLGVIFLMGLAGGLTPGGVIALGAWTAMILGVAYGVWSTERNRT